MKEKLIRCDYCHELIEPQQKGCLSIVVEGLDPRLFMLSKELDFCDGKCAANYFAALESDAKIQRGKSYPPGEEN
jgi:hypothetical protein